MAKDISGMYQHYKGKKYFVIGLAKHTETKQKLVLYQPLYDCNDLKQEYGLRPYFVRPYKMFFGKVEFQGKLVDRFQKVALLEK